jgi:hypothetical protein
MSPRLPVAKYLTVTPPDLFPSKLIGAILIEKDGLELKKRTKDL